MRLLLLPGMGVGLLLWMWLVETQRLRVLWVTVPVRRLPAAWNGRRVVHISDLHTRSHMRWGRPLALLVNHLAPDLLVCTGDLCLRGWQPIAPAAGQLAAMRAPQGRYYVPGNWDYRKKPPRWDDVNRAVTGAGFTVLRNQAVELDGLWLVGLDEPYTRRADPQAAMAAVPPGAPTLVIAHHSTPAEALADRCDLYACGHTHGGQIRLPLIGYVPPSRGHRFRWVWGQYRLGRMLLSVTSGIGTVGLPLRLLCPPEILVYTLVPAGDA